MRLNAEQIELIRSAVREYAGPQAVTRLFGSRRLDGSLGGDVDLLIDCPQPVDAPAMLAARIGGRISRGMGGRKVDVLLNAPNLLQSSVHAIALQQGLVL